MHWTSTSRKNRKIQFHGLTVYLPIAVQDIDPRSSQEVLVHEIICTTLTNSVTTRWTHFRRRSKNKIRGVASPPLRSPFHRSPQPRSSRDRWPKNKMKTNKKKRTPNKNNSRNSRVVRQTGRCIKVEITKRKGSFDCRSLRGEWRVRRVRRGTHDPEDPGERRKSRSDARARLRSRSVTRRCGWSRARRRYRTREHDRRHNTSSGWPAASSRGRSVLHGSLASLPRPLRCCCSLAVFRGSPAVAAAVSCSTTDTRRSLFPVSLLSTISVSHARNHWPLSVGRSRDSHRGRRWTDLGKAPSRSAYCGGRPVSTVLPIHDAQ